MRATTKAFLGGIAAAAVPALCFGSWHRIHTAEWLICNLKVPGESAILQIQADMDAGRHDIAKQKLDAFAKSWDEFSSGPDSCSGRGIIDLPRILFEISDASGATNVEPDAANARQPFHSETNVTPLSAKPRP